MSNLFGTDGIRGTVDIDLTTDLAFDVGCALAAACRDGVLGPRTDHPRVVVGRDTRPSGPRIEDAFTSGLGRGGAIAMRGGVLPSPAVAYLTAHLEADAGVVISASHNPPRDNGIKIFGPGGWKLPARAERTIESLVGDAPPEAGGAPQDLPDASDRYVEHLTSGEERLDGLRVVVDCANGAAYRAAPEALRRLGADVTVLNDSDDGERINDGCGALHPEVVAQASRTSGTIGITLDGDADRVLLADEEGNIVDGDAIIAILASRMQQGGRLQRNGIVVTVMANQALRRWCATNGIRVVETPVGDRHVLEALRSGGLVLGGEQSGHVVMLDRATTGDGPGIAIEVLEAVASSGGRLADLVPFRPMPQVLVNVRANGRAMGDAVRDAIAGAERRLQPDGRVLVRPSGTEPLVRVMVEASDRELAAEVAETVAAAVRRDGGVV